MSDHNGRKRQLKLGAVTMGTGGPGQPYLWLDSDIPGNALAAVLVRTSGPGSAWITEYWHEAEGRWVRVDPQHLEHSFVSCPEDLQPGEFLIGGEAWTSYRHGGTDATAFGVAGTENFGPAEISGNAIRDLAALNKVEMLPWDEWGRMTAAYAGQTGPDYDELIDEVAAACASDRPGPVVDLYSRPELRVPAELIQ